MSVQYHFINITVFVTKCSFKRFSGKNVLVYSSNMQFVNKDNVYLKISLDVFGHVSSRWSAAFLCS